MSSRLVPRISLLVLLALTACGVPLQKAPIVERQPTTILEESPRAMVSGSPSQSVREAPQVAPPGYYIVKKGDTLIGIGLDSGNDWRELAVWNNLDNPNRILVGQQLRIVAPGADPNAVAEAKPIAAPVDIRPVAEPTARKTSDATTGAVAAVGVAGAAGTAAVGAGAAAVPATPPAAVRSVEKAADKGAEKPAEKSADRAGDKAGDKVEGAGLAWSWPANGPIVEAYSEGRNKGIDIALKAGDPVGAALDGQVVYAGSALRGYGNLIILKHNPGYLTAYAHNRKLLVKEGDPVKRGQQIAEAGNTDAERVKLHFEIRKGGKPVDPVKYLPAR